MVVSIFSDTDKVEIFVKLLSTLSFRSSLLSYKMYDNYDDFIVGLPSDNCRAVIIARKGADGMESARNAKLIRPDIPLVWFSDDHGFGVESFRIGCAYFSADTLCEERLYTALERCESFMGQSLQNLGGNT